jgi:hypothetical protein
VKTTPPEEVDVPKNTALSTVDHSKGEIHHCAKMACSMPINSFPNLPTLDRREPFLRKEKPQLIPRQTDKRTFPRHRLFLGDSVTP